MGDESAEAPRNKVLDLLEDGAGTKDVTVLAKAYFVGEASGSESRALLERDKKSDLFSRKGALAPVYDPDLLTLTFESSSALRPNVDAYVTNIDSYGHTFEPVLNLDSQEAREKVRDALRIERAAAKSAAASKEALTAGEPTDAEVDARVDELRIQIRSERAFLENFFENCTPDMPFSGPEGLRGLTRQDIEVIGSGYWEVLRNALGGLAAFGYMPGRSMRLMPVDQEIVDVKVRRRASLLSAKEETVRKRFRRYMQISETGDRVVYFKEFGDPRFVDAVTGEIFPTAEEAHKKAKADNRAFVPATEILSFKISSTRTPYGVPRWIGSLLAVLGTRQAEEMNFLYFENRSVPPLAVIVSGGRLNSDSTARLTDYVANEIRGKRNAHKIMILEADSSADTNAGKMKIVLQPLTDAQQKDGTFQDYDERNADKVGQSFRLPRLLRGDVRDFNRSTAEASVDFAEIQVFGPIRQQFDWMMNKLILPVLDVRYHTFKSNAPTVRDPEALSIMIRDLVTASVITPGEGRLLAEGVFNREFEKVRAIWTEQPVALTLAGHNMDDNLNTPGDESADYDAADPLAGFNAAGGMSAGGAGAAQAAAGVNGGIVAAKGAGVRELRARRDGILKRDVSILHRVHAALLKAEREEFSRSQAEHIKIPVDIFHTFFAPPAPASAPAKEGGAPEIDG